MKLNYFKDTDTLYIVLQDADDVKVAETKDLDENTLLDVDSAGNVVAITIEHASQQTNVQRVELHGIAA